MNKKIFLIGLPGSGKSTLGRQLADQLQMPFVDLDKAIEGAAHKAIENIFKDSGEAGFRAIETEVLRQHCALPNDFVMATGGGAPCFGDNLGMMNKVGTTIFLDVLPKTIATRIMHETAHRPLLKHETPDSFKDRIEFLRSQRISFYKQAHHTISGSEISVQHILDLIS